MKPLSSLLKTAVAGAIALAATAPWIAAAATGPWSWHDISSQLTTQNNRPVWTVAHSNDGWFYTDGQNLWDGGQAYRYDGVTQINITTDVRNAGLDRVDDIVSDNAGTVLFLQDVVRLDNNLRAITYRNGSYVNVTSAIRNVLQSDEGISKINGRDGTWYIVTTKARLFRFTASSLAVAQISLPSYIQNRLGYASSLFAYNVNNGSPAADTARVVLDIVPLSNNSWLLTADPTDGAVVFYRYDGSSFTDITSAIKTGVERVLNVASNGTSALISMQETSGVTSNRVTNGSTSYGIAIGGNTQLTDAVIGWNGTSWMIINDKQLYRLAGAYPSGTTAEDFGRINDLVLAIAADNNGTFILGGAASTQESNNPSSPLTAKLIKVIEDGGTSEGTTSGGTTTGGAFGGDRVYSSTYGPRVTIQGNPSGFRVKDGGEFAYRVTASDSNGVDRIDLYVNDARIRTCTATDACEYRTTYYLKGATTRSVKFWVRATDKSGYSTDTSANPDYLTIDYHSNATADGTLTNANTNSTTSNTGSGINAREWLEPSVTSFDNNDTVKYGVGAWDADGIAFIQILANGSVRQTCDLGNATGNIQCSANLYADDYAANTNVFVNAKVSDRFGNILWTTGKNISRNETTNNSSNNGNTSVWETFSPDTTSLDWNASVAYRAETQDSDGVNRIELYANGSLKQACDLGNATGNAQCSTTLFANDYAANTNVFVNAKVIDRYGNATWSTGRTISRNGTTASNGSTNNAATSVWNWLDPNVSSFNANETVAYSVGAQDSDGIRKIRILVNGNERRRCDFDNAIGNVLCDTRLYANDYSANTNIFVNAEVTDANGNVTWAAGKNIFRNETTASNGSTPNVETSRWIWLEPDRTTLDANDRTSFNVGAQDTNGIDRIEIYVNGSVKRSCTFSRVTSNVACAYDIQANDYAANTDVFVNANVTDALGNVAWTDGRTLRRLSSGSTTMPAPSTGSVSAWDWLDPGIASISQNGAVTFHAGAWSSASVSEIVIFVNGNALPACTFANGSGTVECWQALKGSDYPAGTNVFVNARVRDRDGREAWSAGQTFAVTALSGSGASSFAQTNPRVNSNASISVTSNRENGYAANDAITISASASDPDGIQRIELYLNAFRLKTCYGTSCSASTSIYSLYPANQYRAVVFDTYGNYTTSPTKVIYKK